VSSREALMPLRELTPPSAFILEKEIGIFFHMTYHRGVTFIVPTKYYRIRA